MELVDALMYCWMDPELVGMISYFDNVEKVDEAHVEVNTFSD